MWGRLEWYYFIQDKYGDCVGIVEYLGEYIRENSHLDDIKKLGYVATAVIILLIALKAAEFIKNPNQEEAIESSRRRREHQSGGRGYKGESTDHHNED